MIQLKCCVIDDEPLARDLIGSYVDKTPFLSLTGKYASAQDAIRAIIDGDTEVVFLDINMPQLTGMEFARLIPESCRIIFITAYDRYALESFKVNALDYLMKPVSYDEFLNAATKALKWHEMRRAATAVNAPDSPTYIIVKSDYKLLQIPVADIMFIEGVKDYAKIYMHETDTMQPVTTLMSMKALESSLPQPPFMRVHRSFIVNTDRITVIERNRIVFGQHYIPVSESYRPAFQQYLRSRTVAPE